MARNLRMELREALQCGDFGSVCTIVPQFRQSLDLELIAALNEEDRLRLLQESLDFVEESLHLARVMRAHLAAKLSATESLCMYQPQRKHTSGWSVNG